MGLKSSFMASDFQDFGFTFLARTESVQDDSSRWRLAQRRS